MTTLVLLSEGIQTVLRGMDKSKNVDTQHGHHHTSNINHCLDCNFIFPFIKYQDTRRVRKNESRHKIDRGSQNIVIVLQILLNKVIMKEYQWNDQASEYPCKY